MAYNHTPYGFGGPPFFSDNMPQDDSRGQEELSMTGSWYSQIDPSLSQVDPSMLGLQMSNHGTASMAFQVQQDVQIQTREYHQQPPMQRYVNETQMNLFTATTGQVFSHGLNQPGAPTQSLPQTGYMRHASPSLSQGLSSTCTSAQSPNTEPDWSYYSQGRDEYGIRGGVEFYASSPRPFTNSPTPFESAPVHYQHYTLPQAQGNSCVNMSQVQGFADPQEVTFEADEGYDEMAMKSEYNLDSERQEIKTESRHSHPELQEYHYHTDSAVGSSIKDVNSPENTSIHAADDATSDIDAEGEVDHDGDAIEVDPASDTEYTPRSTRTRKRPSSSHSTKPTPSKKNGRVSKSSSSKNKLSCKSCDAPPFKDVQQLARHVASAHTRAFVCVFAFAGCASTFASKNEWKRHVSSQHLNLTAWVCELGSCGKTHGHSPSKAVGKGGSEFNRKDLFTQHLRRMHAPHTVKRKKQIDEAWEKELKDLQVSCLKVKRQAPVQLRCPVRECGVSFEGQNCWDERMEHVGKHLERSATQGEIVDQGRDGLLVEWAVRERIVELRAAGAGYRLVVGGVKRDEDEDAEGEME